MALIEWQDSFSVGVTRLDDDHKRLIGGINRIDEAEKSGKSVRWARSHAQSIGGPHLGIPANHSETLRRKK